MRSTVLPVATVAFAALAAKDRKVHIIGTTGLSAADEAKIRDAAKTAKIVKSGNMSLGVNLLAALAAQPGRAFSRLQLLEASQGAAFEGYERSIDAHIKNLRAKIEPDPKNPKYIETVFGIGYRFSRAAAGKE